MNKKYCDFYEHDETESVDKEKEDGFDIVSNAFRNNVPSNSVDMENENIFGENICGWMNHGGWYKSGGW